MNKFRSKAIQTEINSMNRATSPMKTSTFTCVATSPFKVQTCVDIKPTNCNFNKASRKILTVEEQSDSDISYTPSVIRPESSPSTHSLQIESTYELEKEDKKQEKLIILEYSIKKDHEKSTFLHWYPQQLLLPFRFN